MKAGFLLTILVLCTPAALFAQLDGFTGAWANVDRNTRDITRVTVTAAGNVLDVHVWGRCHPTDCDWGVAEGYAYAGAVNESLAAQARRVTVVYRPGFSETILVMQLLATGQLQIELFTRFLDNSGRTGYNSTQTFSRTTFQ